MKNLILAITILAFSGCSHCSLTRTQFEGETSGINPYGKGEVKVDRISYWGNLNCVGNLKMENE